MEKDIGWEEDDELIDGDTKIDNQNTEDIELLKREADNLVFEERYEEAIGCLDRILDIRPDNEEIMASKGFTFCLLGDFDEGFFYLEEASRINPASKSVLIMTADAYLRYKRPDISIQVLDQAIDMYPDDDGLVMLKEIILMTKFRKKEYYSLN